MEQGINESRFVAMRPLFVMLILVSISVADPIKSGVPVGQRPGPYSFLIATGPERGQQTCYICETGDKAAIIVFARSVSPELSKLVQQIEKSIAATPKDSTRGWVTILGEKTISLDELARYGQQNSLKIPLGIFDDAVGPPTYRLNSGAEFTVLVFKNQKVLNNFALVGKEVTEQLLKELAAAIAKIQ
jgi:hypothetical protein